MNTQKILINLFEGIMSQIKDFSDNDIEKLESGNYDISLKITKKNTAKKTKKSISDEELKLLLTKLELCKTREEGLELLNSTLVNRNQLELFAKRIDVFVRREDKVDKIKNNIIESTIGATLRSSAIQGNKT